MPPILIRVANHRYTRSLRQTLHLWREQPEVLRRLLRDSPPAQIILCAGLGIAVGIAITLIHEAMQLAHQQIFQLTADEHLSAATDISRQRIFFIPIFGGFALGGYLLLMKLWRPREITDRCDSVRY